MKNVNGRQKFQTNRRTKFDRRRNKLFSSLFVKKIIKCIRRREMIITILMFYFTYFFIHTYTINIKTSQHIFQYVILGIKFHTTY